MRFGIVPLYQPDAAGGHSAHHGSAVGVVPDDENIVVSTNQGEPLVGNKSLAGQAYENICHRIMGEDVPLLDLYQKNGLFSKIKNKFKS